MFRLRFCTGTLLVLPAAVLMILFPYYLPYLMAGVSPSFVEQTPICRGPRWESDLSDAPLLTRHPNLKPVKRPFVLRVPRERANHIATVTTPMSLAGFTSLVDDVVSSVFPGMHGNLPVVFTTIKGRDVIETQEALVAQLAGVTVFKSCIGPSKYERESYSIVLDRRTGYLYFRDEADRGY